MEGDEEFYKKWKVDIWNTLFANIVPMLFLFVVFTYIHLTLDFLNSIEDNINMQLIALLVYIFSVVKILSYVRVDRLQYKRRKTNNVN